MKIDSDFVDVASDFGFKRLMSHSELVQALLCAWLPFPVVKVKPLPIKESFVDESIRFDFMCTTNDGKVVNVEIQKNPDEESFDKALFYSALRVTREPIPVYHFALTDFSVEECSKSLEPSSRCWKVWSRLCIDPSRCRCEPAGRVQEPLFLDTDFLCICLLSLPRFKKSVEKAVTAEERFMWLFSHLGGLKESIPEWALEGAFKDIVELMNKKHLSKLELSRYEWEIQERMGVRDQVRAARMTGLQEGMMATYKILKQLGLEEQDIQCRLFENFGKDAQDFWELHHSDLVKIK